MSYIIADEQDLFSPAGQAKVLSDISEELNHQFQVSQTASELQIVAYGKSSINPLPYNPGQIFSTSIQHNLGYAPVFMVLSFFSNKYNGENGFFSFPYYDGMASFWATSDIVSLNVNLQYNSSVFLDAYTYQFAYYIFNQPGSIR